MPFKDNLEMLCDYLGAGRAYMKKNFFMLQNMTGGKINVRTH